MPQYRPTLVCLAIVLCYIAFTLLTLPTPPPGMRILAINKDIFDSTTAALSTDWTRLLWPMEYEMKRIYWPPATLFPTYFAERYLGPLSSFLLFSCTFIATAFVVGYRLTGSLVFASTLAYMFAFGTQINYVYTFGSLIPLYLILTFCALNLYITVRLVRNELSPFPGYASFVASLLLLAFSSEWWMNYGVALISATTFGIGWAHRHQQISVRQTCTRLALSTTFLLLAYLMFRLQFPGQFFRAGEEEELLLTYSSPILMLEDFVTNFLTYLYMVLDNYIPSFVSSSNSLTYVGPQILLAEQHGYHAQYQHLVLMSHLFMWRFYAGIAATLFFAFFFIALRRAWKDPQWQHAIVVALLVMIVTGFATHLMIKMRPYNTAAALGYKVTFSVSAFTILVSYVVMQSWQRVKDVRNRWWLVAAVWGCVFVAALTRPGMQSALLAQVGLVGLRDPLGQITSLF